MIRIPTSGVLNPSEPIGRPTGNPLPSPQRWAGSMFAWSRPKAEPPRWWLRGGATWAPNSRNLIFTRRGVNKRQLAIVDVPTKQVKILPAFVGSASQPAWGN